MGAVPCSKNFWYTFVSFVKVLTKASRVIGHSSNRGLMIIDSAREMIC